MRTTSRFIAGLLLATALIASSRSLRAQPLPSPSNIIDDDYERSHVEERLEDEGRDVEGPEESWHLDELEDYRRQPIDLRRATADALARLPGISLPDADAILSFIEEHAPIAIDELDSIPELSAEGLLSLKSYTLLRGERSIMQPPSPVVDLRMRFATDLQPRRGYHDQLYRGLPHLDPITGDSTGIDTMAIGSSYLGDRTSLLTTISGRWRMLSAGITVEKDAGEPFIIHDTLDYTYDRYEYVSSSRGAPVIRTSIASFIGAHAALRLDPMTIHLGDYTAEFGQGLLFGSPFSGRKGSDAVKAPYRSARGLASYGSSGEAYFLRGIGITLKEDAWLPSGISASIFASRRPLDASIEGGGDTGDEITIGAIRDDGLHRTRGEVRASGNLLEQLIGAHLEARYRGWMIGVTAYDAWYGAPIEGSMPGRLSGDRVMIGVDGRYRLWWGSLFGEIARSSSGAPGGLCGITATLGATELVLAARWLPAEFETPHGAGFGEAPLHPRNERGVYAGIGARIAPGVHCSAYIDLYDSPDRTHALSFPRSGADGLLQCVYQPGGGIELRGRIRSERGRDELPVIDELDRERRRVLDRTSTTGTIDAAFRSRGERVRLAARFQRRVVEYDAEAQSQQGILTYIDLRLRPLPTLQLGARIALFRSDGSDAALYQAEQDLPGRITNRSFSGEGRRFYLYLRWRPFGDLSLAARYAETVYADRRIISPGSLQQIDGRVDNALALQLDVRFGAPAVNSR